MGLGCELLFEQALMRGGIVELDKVLVSPLEFPWRPRRGKLIVIQPSLDVKMGLHQIHIAFALRTDNGLVINLQACTDRFKILGDIGPAAI